MDISLYINNLLYLHDCVILPGFGGFVSNYKNAGITDKYLFLPPRKVVAFNRNLSDDDGLLLNYIVAKEVLKYPEAKSYVAEYLSCINKSLLLNQEVIFEGIGSFKMDKNKILLFEPLQSSNFYINSYGLSTFYFPEIKRIKNIEKIDRIFKDKESVKPNIRRISFSKVAAYLTIIILLTLIPYRTDFVSNLKMTFSSLSFSNKDIEPAKMINKNENINNPVIGIDSNLTTQKPDTEIANKKIVNLPEPEIQLNSDNYPFHIIAGCFRNLNNARNFFKTLKEKGLNPVILNLKNGLYKVSVGSFESKGDAISQINSIHNSVPDITVWILTG